MSVTDITSLLATRLEGIDFSTDEQALLHYGRDWTRFHTPRPEAVLWPRSTEQVQRIVRLANELGKALVPSGGRTGYSAGAVATAGEWVVTLEKMRRIGDFDPVDRLVTVEAGVITEQLQQFATQQDLFYPVDFASAGSSQIGGNIATNAGGIRVLRYGMTRDYVAGLTVVTGSGDILQLNNGLVKNATGLDLRHLMIGSEGVLGIVTEAQMRLIDPPPPQSVMLLALSSLDAVMRVFALARKKLTLSSFELFSDVALKHVRRHRELPAPFEATSPWYVLLEFDHAGEQDEAAAMAFFEEGLEAGDIEDGIFSQSLEQAAQLWQYREGISESIAALTPYKNDIAVRVSQVPEFMRRLEALLKARHPELETVWFGHIGDGNLHLNIVKPEDLGVQAFQRLCEGVSADVYGLIEAMHGSISAEHGVGLLKKPYLHHSRSPQEIALMRQIKQAFDPNNVMNPGKMLPEA